MRSTSTSGDPSRASVAIQPAIVCKETPMIAFQVYADARAAAMNFDGRKLYGCHRANMCLDSQVEIGV